MPTGHRVLWFLRWLALLTIAAAVIGTGVRVCQIFQGRHWSLVHDRTENLALLFDALLGHSMLVMTAALVWVLAFAAERLDRGAPRP